MAVLELEVLKNYLNGLHNALVCLKKDEPVEAHTFAKVFVNEDEIVVALNAELTDFAETGINVDAIEKENMEDTKVGVSIRDDESFENALKAIKFVAENNRLEIATDVEINELNPEDYMYHEGDKVVKVIVYRPQVKKITVKVPQYREVKVTKMVPLTFMQKLIMVGADEKEKENHERVRKNFDALMDRFLKNKVKYRVVKRGVKVTFKRELLAKLVITGKRTIKVYLAVNPLALDARYHAVDCTEKNGYQQVPACVKVTGIVSLNRALELIDQVINNFEVPVNKKYVPNYSYSREMAENYLASLKEKEETKEEVVNA
jgi:predicted HTH domain antitoxin